MGERELGARMLEVHIKNNRDSALVFRITPERLAEALERNADMGAGSRPGSTGTWTTSSAPCARPMR